MNGLPRGIPAASLKGARQAARASLYAVCLPRGIPAASLKGIPPEGQERVVLGLPRGIPAASLKDARRRPPRRAGRGLPRGIPAASLKEPADQHAVARLLEVFRGEYPRPH